MSLSKIVIFEQFGMYRMCVKCVSIEGAKLLFSFYSFLREAQNVIWCIYVKKHGSASTLTFQHACPRVVRSLLAGNLTDLCSLFCVKCLNVWQNTTFAVAMKNCSCADEHYDPVTEINRSFFIQFITNYNNSVPSVYVFLP